MVTDPADPSQREALLAQGNNRNYVFNAQHLRHLLPLEGLAGSYVEVRG